MSPLAIDTAAARRLGDSLVHEGDRLRTEAAWLESLARVLHLRADGFAARRAIEQAAERAWSAGTLLHLSGDAAERADRFDLGTHDAAAEWAATADGLTRSPVFGTLIDRWWSPRAGDLGGTGEAELRSPYTGLGRTPTERGRNLVARALADTADADQLRPDEFGIVALPEDHYILVLPGVVDLSHPRLGFDDGHRSVRDLDRAAVRSAWSSSVDHNPYAQMVWDAVRAAGVPPGAALLLVGHSFGADTAVDLAANRRFNGDEYRVTHVVAAGYHVDRQVPDVAPATEVLVLQNRSDLPVIGEAIAHSSTFTAAVAGIASASPLLAGGIVAGSLRTDGVDGARERARDLAVGPLAAAAELGGWAVQRRDDLADLAVGAATHDHSTVVDAGAELLLMRTGVRRLGSNAVVDVFDGGASGFGHHPGNYVEHVTTTTDTAVTRFLASLDDAGYARPGSAVAVDVSVPRQR